MGFNHEGRKRVHCTYTKWLALYCLAELVGYSIALQDQQEAEHNAKGYSKSLHIR